MPDLDYILLEENGTKGQVQIDGQILQSSSIERYGDGRLYASFWDDAVTRIDELTLSALPLWHEIKLYFHDTEVDLTTWQFNTIDLHPSKSSGLEAARVEFEIVFDVEFWTRPYSVADLADAVQSFVDRHPELGFQYWQFEENTTITGFGVSCDVPIASTLQKIIGLKSSVLRIAEMIEDEITTFQRSDAVVLTFRFPDSLRIICEQYLIYFAQFLSDLGIEADAELKEDIGRVLFSITPRDKQEALSQIKQALAQYLQIPTCSDLERMTNGMTDVAVHQLKANVLHLQSQIFLLKSIAEQKAATVASQKAHIGILEERLDMRQFLPAPGTLRSASCDSEWVLEGILAVKDFEKSGLVVKIPEIFRRLKRRLSS